MSLRLGLIGHPVEHSLSPPLHRAAMSYLGLAGSYELIDLELDMVTPFVAQAAQKGFSGFNVTIPYKEQVFNLLNGSPEAKLLGAVNTVRIDSAGVLHAHNTDLGGFIAALERLEPPAQFFQEGALVLGAGGAARAVIAGLFIMGARDVHVAARGVARVEQICKELGARISQFLDRDCPVSVIRFAELKEIASEPALFSLVVNCTPIGLHDSDEEPEWARPLFATCLPAGIFLDIVYRRDRSNTILMKLAGQQGLKVSDGLPMLVEQAALAFEFWSGRSIDRQQMYNALE